MLRAVLFDFNGIIINDETIHEQLLERLLLEENLRPQPGEFQAIALGRSDRVCLTEMFARRGRVLDETDLDRLLQRKAEAYREILASLEPLPLYPGLTDFLLKLRFADLRLALVSGAMRLEIETVLDRAKLRQQFPIIVAGDDITTSKPDPAGYLTAIAQLNLAEPGLNLQPSECLAIEDSFAGIEAAKRAGIPVVGVANMFPQHMLLRVADWAVDELAELEFDRVVRVFSGEERAVAAPQVSAIVETG